MWMDLEIIKLNEVRPRKTSILWYQLYVESEIIIQMNLFTKQKQIHRLRKQTYDYQKAKVEGEGLIWDKLQYFGLLIQRADSLEKTLMLGKEERGWQRMKWLDGITDSIDVSLSKF